MTDAIDRYAAEVGRRLSELLEEQRGELSTAARWMAATLERGGLIFVTGTGHSHILAEEGFYRAGGLMAVHPVLAGALMLHEGALRSSRLERLEGLAEVLLDDAGVGANDLLVVASNSGRNAVPVEMALVARERGCKVVAVTSLEHSRQVASRHSSGKRLFEVADLTIDNRAPYGDAVVAVENLAGPMGPVSTIMGSFILHAVTCRAAELLAAEGRPPDVFVSANVEGPPREGEDPLPGYRRRIRYL